MKQFIHPSTKRALCAVIILTLLILSACKVTFLPGYDATLSEQIGNCSKSIDKFYLSMLDTTSAEKGGRSYTQFSGQYVNIEVELNSLLNKNRIRSLNENSTRICEITLQLWIKYKAEHKADNTLSDGLIKLNRKTFSDLFYAMQVAEKGKEVVGNAGE
jgi:hypothetical protein